MKPRCTAILATALGTAVLAVGSLPVLAQDEPQSTTVAAVAAGEVTGLVTIDGAALVRADDDGYLFSDGLEFIDIHIDTSTADAEVPLMTLINIVGIAASDEIDVTGWAPLDIMVAAVIRPPEEVIQYYQGWIVAHGSMAPSGSE